MRCLYFSETCALADRLIEVSSDFVEQRIHTKIYDDIATDEVSLCA